MKHIIGIAMVIIAFFLFLGIAGGYEQNNITLAPFIIIEAISAAVCYVGFKLMNEEGH